MKVTDFLLELETVIAERLQMAPEGSYTAKLAAEGPARIARTGTWTTGPVTRTGV